jgi:GNAT superfamily N-acetyltransferase
VIELHRTVFPPQQVNCTIYAAPGVDRYLASLVAFPEMQPEHQIWCAWRANELAGCAHFRLLPDSWHLNNITVLPALQGLGIGRRLWSCFLETARRRRLSRISLHVESDNSLAIEWYRREGLQVTGEVWRYEKNLPPGPGIPSKTCSFRLENWEQAEAWQTAYGFSQFRLELRPNHSFTHRDRYQEETWNIGRLGEHYFRVTQGIPPAVEAALARIDPARRLLILSPAPLEDPETRVLGKSLRMEGALPEGR